MALVSLCFSSGSGCRENTIPLPAAEPTGAGTALSLGVPHPPPWPMRLLSLCAGFLNECIKEKIEKTWVQSKCFINNRCYCGSPECNVFLCW